MLQLSSQEKELLLRIARDAVRARLDGQHFHTNSVPDSLETQAGVFLSIHGRAELRGCIGSLEADTPLSQTIAECAVAAALADPRFAPVTTEELPHLSFEISVLSQLERVTDPRDIRVPGHGLLIEREEKRGLLLPQVAERYGWDRTVFLSETCSKAGLDRAAWQNGADIFVFEALVFEEWADSI